jgi:hypothetical protein
MCAILMAGDSFKTTGFEATSIIFSIIGGFV